MKHLEKSLDLRIVSKHIHLIPFLLIVLTLGCSSEDSAPENPQGPISIDTTLFKLGEIEEPYTDVAYDTQSDLIYFMSRIANTQMITYNYTGFEVEGEGIKEEFLDIRTAIALGDNNGEKELYINSGKAVGIYNANTLELKDRITVFSDQDIEYIESIDYRSPNLLFVGPCNTRSSAAEDDGIMVYNVDTKAIVNRARYGIHCMNIHSFIEDASSGQIGVLGLQGGSDDVQIKNIYDAQGNLISNSFFRSTTVGLGETVSNDQSDFLIALGSGNVFLKSDLSVIGNLGRDLNGAFFNNDGSRVYVINGFEELEVYDYPSLNQVGTVSLPSEAARQFTPPSKGFIDNDKLILVYFLSKGVYLSMLDIPNI